MMIDPIDRQTALDALDELCDVVCAYSKKQRAAMCGACPLGSAFDVIEELPPAERKGHWTLQEDRTKKLYGWHICSECGAWIGEPANFCSECGADMRGNNDGREM